MNSPCSGNFFARLGRRVRSKSPVVARLATVETPKKPSKGGAHADVTVNGSDHHEDWCVWEL